jgi:hypothetical protein
MIAAGNGRDCISDSISLADSNRIINLWSNNQANREFPAASQDGERIGDKTLTEKIAVRACI